MFLAFFVRRIPWFIEKRWQAFAVGGLDVTDGSLDAQSGQNVEPKHLFVGQSVARTFDFDKTDAFRSWVPQGEVRKAGSRVTVVSEQSVANAAQLVSLEAEEESHQVMRALEEVPADGRRGHVTAGFPTPHGELGQFLRRPPRQGFQSTVDGFFSGLVKVI